MYQPFYNWQLYMRIEKNYKLHLNKLQELYKFIS